MMASFLQAGGLDLSEDVEEQRDVAVDQVEPALVGLSAQAGGDADQVAGGDQFVGAGTDALIGDEGCAVQEVEGLALARGRR